MGEPFLPRIGALERRLLVALQSTDMPLPEQQVPVGLRRNGHPVACIDLAWPDLRIAVSCNEWFYHLWPRQLEVDEEQQAWLAGEGWLPLTFWEGRLRFKLDNVVRRLGKVVWSRYAMLCRDLGARHWSADEEHRDVMWHEMAWVLHSEEWRAYEELRRIDPCHSSLPDGDGYWVSVERRAEGWLWAANPVGVTVERCVQLAKTHRGLPSLAARAEMRASVAETIERYRRHRWPLRPILGPASTYVDLRSWKAA